MAGAITMAETKSALWEIDGKLFLQVTPGRAQALVEALEIALSSDKLARFATILLPKLSPKAQ
jgi:hypothetical protein